MADNNKPLSEIRDELKGRLGGSAALSSRVWAWLADEGHLFAVLDGEKDIAWLAERVIKFHEAAGTAPTVFQPKPELTSKAGGEADQIEARSRIIAHYARERPGVQAFRREVLHDQLLKPEEVEAWIQTASKIDEDTDRPSRYVTLPQPPGSRVAIRDQRLTLESDKLSGSRVVRLSSELLAYGVPESQWMRRVVARHGGILDRLRLLAESLEQEYQWPEATGTLFVLTDMIPLLSRIRQTLHGGTGRITFNIDAATVTPRQLAEFYGRTLATLRRGRRIRALTDKHVRLAVFAVEQSAKPWAQRHLEWNEEFPDWGYAAASNFRRDALRAERQLIEPVFSVANTFEYATSKPAPSLSPEELEKAHRQASPNEKASNVFPKKRSKKTTTPVLKRRIEM